MKNILGVALLLLLVGCGSSTKITNELDRSLFAEQRKFQIAEVACNAEDVPDHFIVAIKSYLKIELQKKQLLYTENDGVPCDVEITITDYRMRSSFNRIMWGAFAGKDGVESTVLITDSSNKLALGKSKISSFNVTIASDLDDIARRHAEEIAEFVAGETPKPAS